MNEEPNGQNQQAWLSRVARERQDLSVSVEETLGSSPLDELCWLDEDEHGLTNAHLSAPEKSFVPPRLSLQSRVVEAIHSEDHAVADLASYAVVPSGEVGERKPNTTTQNTNILMRFAQRLTSSFVAFNSAPQPADALALTAPAGEQTMTIGLKASSLSSIADIEVCTASTMTGINGMTGEMSRERSVSLPVGPLARCTDALPVGSQRQRLAGRTTRVRLEVVPGATATATAPSKQSPQAHHAEPTLASYSAPDTTIAMTGDEGQRLLHNLDAPHPSVTAETTGMHLSAIATRREREREQKHTGEVTGSTSMHLPTVKSMPEAAGMTSGQMQAWRLDHAETRAMPELSAAIEAGSVTEARARRGSLSGSGSFESGQSDASVPNPYITASSVVLVTLTTNPGPVVVQYISLQPQVSFTVHLTAPTANHTIFNYIILLGELF
ncbi:hypothetical protein [Dictyobacter arantiisoli]|uniref:hypothetical protein n=1 Tax=Dictyobacter arantiisoli TaxID=2014874 RepID=UPI0011EC5F35|nr:hypothetical protein [Dictyobacter arantiisoli]